METQRLMTIALVVAQVVLTNASWGNIAGYASGSKVTSHNAIDLDQKAIENALSAATIDYSLVKNIYEQGGNSKSYAEFTVPPLTFALSKGDTVVGATSGAGGMMYSSYSASDTTIRVAYATSDTQSTYVDCKVGALLTAPSAVIAGASQAYQFTSGCFQAGEDLTITTSSGIVTITPTAGPTNKAGRTLQGFSTKAGGLMYLQGTNGGCAGGSDRATDGCPYRDFKMYYDYYGDFHYADKFVLAAINAQATGFTNPAGNMNFTGAADVLRKECIKKGTAHMNSYMYAIREFEDAIDDCKAGCTNGIANTGSGSTGATCNSLSTAAVHAWDEGVAFYTGSLEGTDVGGNSNGALSYRLAEKRCANFKTCGPNHDSLTGTSYVNTELFKLFSIGAHSVLLGHCEAARPVVRKIAALGAIPLIQGTLRYAYKLNGGIGTDKERGEGAVFAAAIVPRVNFCSSADASTIMNNMKVGATSTSFAAVKAAFENNYACMEITCAEVGGYWSTAQNKYYDGAEPCGAIAVNQATGAWESIAGYAPGSKVTSHNAIDLDQKAIDNALSAATIDFTLVKNIYEQGGNSKTYAEFTVPALGSALSKGDAVVGATSGATGTMYSSYSAGVTAIRVTYATSALQGTYVSCKVGALEAVPSGTTASATQPYQLTSGCFQAGENLIVTTSGGSVTVSPTAGPTNKAARTLQGFSTKAGSLMYTQGTNGGCQGDSDRASDGCPYRDFKMYYDYYGDFHYADKFVLAAINAQATGFTNPAGNMNFTGAADVLRKECIKKGTAYMNAYMYAIREFEDAIDDCKAGCIGGILGAGASCNSLSTASVHAWDEGVAFYTGSLEGTSAGGSSAGVLSYRLAEKRCANFKTCGPNGNALTGISYVNSQLFSQFAVGANFLLLGQCEATRPVVRKIAALGAIPLIQGTLRYAYKLNGGVGTDKERGEGAVFAAAIVPRVNFCSSEDATTIMNHMKVGATSTSFAVVKAAFENNYACMEITCAEVGGYWYSAMNKYYDGAEPCSTTTQAQGTSTVTQEEEILPTWAIIFIIVVAILALVLLILSLVCMQRANKYQHLAAGKSGGGGQTIGTSNV